MAGPDCDGVVGRPPLGSRRSPPQTRTSLPRWSPRPSRPVRRSAFVKTRRVGLISRPSREALARSRR